MQLVRSQPVTILFLDLLMNIFHHQTFMIVTSTLSTSRLIERQTSKDLFFSTSIRVMLRTSALVRSLLHLLVSELLLVRELPMKPLEPDLLTLILLHQTVEHLEERMVTFNFPCHCPRPVKSVSAVLLDTILSHRNSYSNLLDSLCLLYTSPSPRDQRGSRMPSSA